MLNSEQVENLKAFFIALWCSYHKGTSTFDGGYWADRLDSLEISWSIQNRIAGAAQEKGSNFIYFSSLLKKLGIDYQ